MRYCPPRQIRRATRKTTVDSRIVEANGRKKVLPNSVKRISPGKRPIPSFSSQGSAVEKTMSAMKMARVQRIMRDFLQSLQF
jgi:hypothetical protein